MKKLVCILLISWLPIFMATANAMSLQMANQAAIGDMQVQVSMPCHGESDELPVEAQSCIGCGFCVIATSIVSANVTPLFHIPEFKSFKSSFVDEQLISINHLPAYRPPILN